MKILILNWRDIKNPNFGGAEVLTHEMAKRWVRGGHEVIQFSSTFKGSKKEEYVDGVKYIRDGKSDLRYLFSSVHFLAFYYYQKFFKRKIDVVIDEIHGIPFFIPLYVKEKKIALICEIAGRIWDTNFPFPFNFIGKFIERNYFNIYRNIPFITISDSTRKELIRYGVSDKKITVLPMGFTKPNSLPKLNKEKEPTLIFAARLLKAKGIEDAINACAMLKAQFPNIKMWVIGRGDNDYEKKLKKLASRLGVEGKISFFGFVSQEKKFELMQKATVLIVPSIKEGFGLTIPEAGLVGTPAIAYDVEGLRDIIKDGHNGLLVKANSETLSEKIGELILDPILYKKIQKGAIKMAGALNWDKTAEVALSELIKPSYEK